MVTFDHFHTEMKRLHVAFGRTLAGEAGKQAFSDRVSICFDSWLRKNSDVSSEILSRIVDRAIEDCDQMPSFAQFKNLKQSVLSKLPHQDYAQTSCSACDGTGLVSATREGYRYSFRCHRCENWQGKCDGLSMWDGRRQDEGYEPLENQDRFDPADHHQVKGLSLLKSVSPNLYEKIIADNPEMRAPVEGLGQTPSMFQDMPSVGPEMSPAMKESLRAESLRRDSIREDEIPF